MNPKDKYKLHILKSISRDIALSGENSIYFRKIVANKIKELQRDA